MPSPIRFHETDRWKEKFDQVPESAKQTISNALAMLEETRGEVTDSHDAETEPIVRVTETRGLGRVSRIAALGDVLIRFYIPPEYPSYIILEDLLWLE